MPRKKKIDITEFSLKCKESIRSSAKDLMKQVPNNQKKYALEVLKFRLEGLAAEIGRELAKVEIEKSEEAA